MVISSFQNRDPLLGEPWYFKSLKDRKTGDKLLRKVGKVNFKHHYTSKQQSYLYFYSLFYVRGINYQLYQHFIQLIFFLQSMFME